VTTMSPQDLYKLFEPLFVHTAMASRRFHNLELTGQPNQILRHAQFGRHLGSNALTVPNVGWHLTATGKVRRNPLHLVCDPLDTKAGGLTPADVIQAELMSLAVEAAFAAQQQIAIVADAHLGKNHVNRPANCGLLVTVDYYAQLTLAEQQKADRYLLTKLEIPSAQIRQQHITANSRGNASPLEKLAAERWLRYAQQNIAMPDAGQVAKPLTVEENFLMLGESPDYEFRETHFNFDHCLETLEGGEDAIARFVPRIADLLRRIFVHNKDQRKLVGAPPNYVWVFNKNDLLPFVFPDQRGMNSNLLETYLRYVQLGTPQGPNHDAERHLVIYGNGTPYTVLFGALIGIACGYTVEFLASAGFNFDAAGISLIEIVRLLRHIFPNAFTARIFWDEEAMGGLKMPIASNGKTYNELAKQVLVQLVDQWQSTGGAGLNSVFYPFGDDSVLARVFVDVDLAQYVK